MKTLVLSMISIAATVAAMTACTSESDGIDDLTKDAPVEIKLNAGINNISVKSVQTPTENNFTANIIAATTSGAYTSSIWTGTDPGKITVVNNEINFGTTQAYPSNGNIIYMKAYAPFKQMDESGKVTFDITGDEDIMISEEVSGSKTDNSSKTLKFSHLLTQLKFNLVASSAAAKTAWGKITGIQVKAIKKLELTPSTNNGLNAATGEVASGISTINFTEAELSTDAANPTDGGYVMVLPKTEKYEVIIFSDNISDEGTTITLTSPSTTEASTSYNITLTFNASNVDVAAEVGIWKDGTGSGVVL